MKSYKEILEDDDVFIIAELGVNYYDISKKLNIPLIEAAKLMIDKAREGGAHAVKFQSYKAETITSKKAPAYWDLKEEPITSQYELFKKYDKFGREEYIDIAKYCKSKELIFLATPFDFDAVDFLFDLVPIFKISSSDLTNLPFIEYIAQKGKPIFLSTGAATLGEIEEAINTILSTGNKEIVLLHCILDYPTKYKDINLNMISFLRNVYPDYLIGFSDHTKPDEGMLVTAIAYTYGARIIEKHFTLDKTLPGNDHYHAMDLNDLKKLRNNIKLIREISGEYHKRPLDCESIARKQARRSIIAQIDINKGEKITRDKVTFKRPGTGIPPSMLKYVIGSIALVDLKKDDVIHFNQIQFSENPN